MSEHGRRRRRRRRGRGGGGGGEGDAAAPTGQAPRAPSVLSQWQWATFPTFAAAAAGVVAMGLFAGTELGIILFFAGVVTFFNSLPSLLIIHPVFSIVYSSPEFGPVYLNDLNL